MAAGENPAAEMVKSVSLIIAGLWHLLPGFSDFLGLLLLLPPVQHLTVKLMPHLRSVCQVAVLAPDRWQ